MYCPVLYTSLSNHSLSLGKASNLKIISVISYNGLFVPKYHGLTRTCQNESYITYKTHIWDLKMGGDIGRAAVLGGAVLRGTTVHSKANTRGTHFPLI